MMSDAQPRVIETKRHAITQDYVWSNRVLGLGINGKVVECTSKTTGEKCALKVCIFSFNIINSTFRNRIVVYDTPYPRISVYISEGKLLLCSPALNVCFRKMRNLNVLCRLFEILKKLDVKLRCTVRQSDANILCKWKMYMKTRLRVTTVCSSSWNGTR